MLLFFSTTTFFVPTTVLPVDATLLTLGAFTPPALPAAAPALLLALNLVGSIGGTGGADFLATVGLLFAPLAPATELATEVTLLALIFLCLMITGELALLLVVDVLAVPVLFVLRTLTVLAALDLLGLAPGPVVVVGVSPPPELAVRKL